MPGARRRLSGAVPEDIINSRPSPATNALDIASLDFFSPHLSRQSDGTRRDFMNVFFYHAAPTGAREK